VAIVGGENGVNYTK